MVDTVGNSNGILNEAVSTYKSAISNDVQVKDDFTEFEENKKKEDNNANNKVTSDNQGFGAQKWILLIGLFIPGVWLLGALAYLTIAELRKNIKGRPIAALNFFLGIIQIALLVVFFQSFVSRLTHCYECEKCIVRIDECVCLLSYCGEIPAIYEVEN